VNNRGIAIDAVLSSIKVYPTRSTRVTECPSVASHKDLPEFL